MSLRACFIPLAAVIPCGVAGGRESEVLRTEQLLKTNAESEKARSGVLMGIWKPQLALFQRRVDIAGRGAGWGFLGKAKVRLTNPVSAYLPAFTFGTAVPS